MDVFTCCKCKKESGFTQPDTVNVLELKPSTGILADLAELFQDFEGGPERNFKCVHCGKVNRITKTMDEWHRIDGG
jgi:hypothetical protein